MDVLTYTTATDVLARLAGRLSDDVVGTAREDYAAGEDESGENAILLNLAYEGVPITAEERELIRSVLGDPHNPDLDDVPSIDEVPPLRYRFSAVAPAGAPDPARADALLAGEAPRLGGRRVRRAWRQPLDETQGSWIYVVQVPQGVDTMRAYSGLAASLWVELKEKWPVEVVVEGAPLPPYQAAALTVAPVVWSA